MLDLLLQNGSTILVGTGIVALLSAIATKTIKDKKNGKSSCGGGCKNCPCGGGHK